jgi:hypothetical protein
MKICFVRLDDPPVLAPAGMHLGLIALRNARHV